MCILSFILYFHIYTTMLCHGNCPSLRRKDSVWWKMNLKKKQTQCRLIQQPTYKGNRWLRRRQDDTDASTKKKCNYAQACSVLIYEEKHTDHTWYHTELSCMDSIVQLLHNRTWEKGKKKNMNLLLYCLFLRPAQSVHVHSAHRIAEFAASQGYLPVYNVYRDRVAFILWTLIVGVIITPITTEPWVNKKKRKNTRTLFILMRWLNYLSSSCTITGVTHCHVGWNEQAETVFLFGRTSQI